ncbi:MAG TPA: glutamate mutase L [Bacillota bacterium]|nr:glutamate mutase L [Bacillota bacterium]
MQIALVADIGSTYTKIIAVDLQGGLVASAQSPTTVEQGIGQGLLEAERLVLMEASLPPDKVALRLSSSSAAGGLRMVTMGLVPELTAAAGRLAALGAGARVEQVFAYRMTLADRIEMERIGPDIVLLAGGADGGDSETVLHNAALIVDSCWRGPVVYAGNRLATDEVVGVLTAAGIEATSVANVMPKLGVLNVDEAREAIRRVFLRKIVHNKGFDLAAGWANSTIMPTPAAVQRGVALTTGLLGEDALLAFDVGGATTDVYSVGGNRVREKAFLQGLKAPREMRTVEGDLGVRVSLNALLCAADPGVCGRHALAEDESLEWAAAVAREVTAELPGRADAILAAICVELAAVRHAGTLELLPTPFGYTGIQRGKDLADVRHIIGTGGLLSRIPEFEAVLSSCLASEHHPLSLLPTQATAIQDRHYVLYAAGLLSREYPQAARTLLIDSLSL